MTPDQIKAAADRADIKPAKDEKGRFLPGNSGYGGRPKGSRNKLGEAFITALHDDFMEHGVATIEQVRIEKPDQYLKVVAGLLPKEIKLTDERELTDAELIDRITHLDEIVGDYLATHRAGEAGAGAEAPSRH